MKRFLLGALGALGLAVNLSSAAEPLGQPRRAPMEKADGGPILMQNDVPFEQSSSFSFDGFGGDVDCGWRVYAGAEALILRPHFSSNQAQTIAVSDPEIDDISRSRVNFKDFDYDWSVSPRLTVGVQNEEGLGARVRWFHFDQSADQVLTETQAGTATTPGVFAGSEATVGNLSAGQSGDGGLLATTTNLFLDVWDLEATQTARLGSTDLVVSGGVRYAFMAQRYNAFSLVGEETGERDVNSTILSRQTFTGAGPTLAIEGQRRLGESSLSVYGSSRGALLFGHGHEEASQTSESTTGGVTTTSITDANAERFEVRGVLELELGLQWEREVGGAGVFVRPSCIGQMYLGGGNARNSTDDFGRVTSSDFGLVGLSLTAGVRF